MKHLGDIMKIKGCSAPVVDCIIGGSPCQDLSIAGKRAGLAGERSGLYMEQIRIIKEMRHADEERGRTGESIRPRYMVWENVPGAFSSNKGKDFAAVLEEAIKVADPEAPDVPVPEKGWPTSGCIMGDNWSVAWRVLDAQFWGVPQRRRRIALVADFGGQSAPEILFIRKGVSRDLDESQQTRKATAGDVKSGTGADDRVGVPYTLKIRSGVEVDSGGKSAGKGALIQTDKTGTLSTVQDQYLFQPVITENSSSFVDVEMEVAVRKYEVDCKPLCECLRDHKATSNFSNKDIAEQLDLPLTQVEHWFRLDKYFAIPEPNVWPRLKKLLGIETTEFDQCITEFEFKASNYAADSRVDIDDSGKVQTLTSRMGTGGGNVPMVMEPKAIYTHPQNDTWELEKENRVQTLSAGMEMGGGNTPLIMEPVTLEPGISAREGGHIYEGVSGTLRANAGDNQMAVAHPVKTYQKVTGPLMANSHPGSYTGQDAFSDMLVAGVDCRNYTEIDEQTASLQAVAGHLLNGNNVVRVKYIVRRLTPLECERLQGFPDGWTDIGEWIDSKGKKHKEADSPRYKALGNSIALPPWKWVLKRLCACYERDATMASLFDGIGGFPLIWEQLNGKGSCLWASEIEEFPMAVTKLRFGGNDNENHVR